MTFFDSPALILVTDPCLNLLGSHLEIVCCLQSSLGRDISVELLIHSSQVVQHVVCQPPLLDWLRVLKHWLRNVRAKAIVKRWLRDVRAKFIVRL